MNSTTKGALAAGAAAVLLLGGAGSLAFWSATDSVDAGSFSSGKLTLKAVGCDAGWTYANGTSAGAAVNLVVPGDSITKNCTFTIGATGDHLSALPTVPSTVGYTVTSTPTPTTLNLTTAATYTVGTTTIDNTTPITSSSDGKTLTAKIVVTMPYGSTTINANDTQLVTSKLNTIPVTLTQQKTTSNNNA